MRDGLWDLGGLNGPPLVGTRWTTPPPKRQIAVLEPPVFPHSPEPEAQPTVAAYTLPRDILETVHDIARQRDTLESPILGDPSWHPDFSEQLFLQPWRDLYQAAITEETNQKTAAHPTYTTAEPRSQKLLRALVARAKIMLRQGHSAAAEEAWDLLAMDVYNAPSLLLLMKRACPRRLFEKFLEAPPPPRGIVSLRTSLIQSIRTLLERESVDLPRELNGISQQIKSLETEQEELLVKITEEYARPRHPYDLEAGAPLNRLNSRYAGNREGIKALGERKARLEDEINYGYRSRLKAKLDATTEEGWARDAYYQAFHGFRSMGEANFWSAPNRLSEAGFRASSEDIERVIREDSETLTWVGVSIDEIVGWIDRILEAGRKGSILQKSLEDDRLTVRRFVYKGTQQCPWDDKANSTEDFIVTNATAGTALSFGGLLRHLIADHHFFEGHTSYRLDPLEFILFLDIPTQRSRREIEDYWRAQLEKMAQSADRTLKEYGRQKLRYWFAVHSLEA